MKLKFIRFENIKRFTIYLVDSEYNSTKICTFFEVPSSYTLTRLFDDFEEDNSKFIVKVFDIHNNYLFCFLGDLIESLRSLKLIVRGQDYEF